MQITNPYEEIFVKLDYLTLVVNKLISQQKTQIEISNSDKLASEFLFIEDIEILLKMPVSTIRHHIDKHNLPCYGATKPIRFKKIEVIKWFEDYSRNPEKFKAKATDILISRRKI